VLNLLNGSPFYKTKIINQQRNSSTVSKKKKRKVKQAKFSTTLEK